MFDHAEKADLFHTDQYDQYEVQYDAMMCQKQTNFANSYSHILAAILSEYNQTSKFNFCLKSEQIS